ncbi:penicillin acylase family protein [Gammaproteobacteria bacterium]|nr:penicillin acylase family protein [Gammaproteobacteria bacterium]MDB4004387.1 penicillin acylase family protein [Gammaproteobacteria bacterium]
MTRLDKTEGKRVDGTRIGLAPLKLAAALSLSALVACAPDESVSNDEASALSNAMKETVDVRWTEHGIPHITAQTWEGLGFGFAHSVAQNGVCVLAKELITVNGELSKYFGAENGNVNSDAFHRALLNDAKIDQYLGASSDDSNAMDSGYARGYNRYIDTHADQLPASCAGAEWVKPIDERDLARLAIGVGIRYGLGRVTDQIATAAPNQAIAALKPIDLTLDVEKIGSNAYAFGSDLTDTGSGILLGNPHYPWQGPSRFHMAHLTLPGEIDFMGVGLIATPRLAIGFNDTIAWSHTVSTALRFTFFRLDLVPGNAMAYLVGDEERVIEAIEVAVETDAGIENRTVYLTHLGPVVAGPNTPWDDQHVYVMRDVNYENYRTGDQYAAMQRATDVTQLRQALADHQGAAFVNTIAADKAGGALYADMSAIPNVSVELISRCAVDQSAGARITTLNGSDPSCDWQVDASAAAPGLMPPSQQPSLITTTYAGNSNDSYWLSNPAMRLEGYSPIIGDENAQRTLRTRSGLKFVEEVVAAGEKFDQATVENLLFSHRHYGAELFLDEVLEVCADDTSLAEACAVLAYWDRQQAIESRGAHVFNEFFSETKQLSAYYAVPFDNADPVHTPRGLTINDAATREAILAALHVAVDRITGAGIALDAKWGDVQFEIRNGEKIGIPGGDGRAGMFSVISARFDGGNGGYTPIVTGNSYIQSVTWNEDGSPNARAILTYSQSPEPDSPFYADQTKIYSQSEWIEMPFTDEQIATKLVREETLEM